MANAKRPTKRPTRRPITPIGLTQPRPMQPRFTQPRPPARASVPLRGQQSMQAPIRRPLSPAERAFLEEAVAAPPTPLRTLPPRARPISRWAPSRISRWMPRNLRGWRWR